MTYTIKIVLSDSTEKAYVIGNASCELPSGLELSAPQITSMLSLISGLADLMEEESWKTVEIEKD